MLLSNCALVPPAGRGHLTHSIITGMTSQDQDYIRLHHLKSPLVIRQFAGNSHTCSAFRVIARSVTSCSWCTGINQKRQLPSWIWVFKKTLYLKMLLEHSDVRTFCMSTCCRLIGRSGGVHREFGPQCETCPCCLLEAISSDKRGRPLVACHWRHSTLCLRRWGHLSVLKAQTWDGSFVFGFSCSDRTFINKKTSKEETRPFTKKLHLTARNGGRGTAGTVEPREVEETKRRRGT